MKRLFVVLMAMMGLALAGVLNASGALAGGPPLQFEEDVTGDVFVCDSTTYTATSGTLHVIVHENLSPSGNVSFTGTGVPKNVVLEDEAGNTYRARGTIHFGGTINAQTGGEQGGTTLVIQIVGEGGATDSLQLVAHFSPGGFTLRDLGTCAEPA